MAKELIAGCAIVVAMATGMAQAETPTKEEKATTEYMQALSKKFEDKLPFKVLDGLSLTKTSVEGTVFVLEYKLYAENIKKYLDGRKLITGDAKRNAALLGEDTQKYLCAQLEIDEPIPFISKGGSMRMEYLDEEGKPLATVSFNANMCSNGHLIGAEPAASQDQHTEKEPQQEPQNPS